MAEIISNASLQDIADRLLQANHVVLSTHVKPDGDAFGGTVALARAIERLGKRASIWHIPPISSSFHSLLGSTKVNVVGDDGQPDPDADLIVIVDTCARSQLDSLVDYIDAHRKCVCVIDHHIQGDDISDCAYVDSTAGSVCEIIADLIALLGIELDKDLATPCYLGMATDTGWFRFSNTSARTMRTAATLLDAGVDHNELLALSEHCDRPSRFYLMARALNSMVLSDSKQAAVLTLYQEDFETVDAHSDDTHGLADLPLSIESVQMVCVIAQRKAGIVKLSLRSKPGENAIDVSAFAGQFGGGGHARASGAKITDADIDDIRDRVLQAVEALPVIDMAVANIATT